MIEKTPRARGMSEKEPPTSPSCRRWLRRGQFGVQTQSYRRYLRRHLCRIRKHNFIHDALPATLARTATVRLSHPPASTASAFPPRKRHLLARAACPRWGPASHLSDSRKTGASGGAWGSGARHPCDVHHSESLDAEISKLKKCIGISVSDCVVDRSAVDTGMIDAQRR
jgi:hypothetical protein